MHILVTNDDGIEAEGIKNLVASLKDMATITVIAPLEEKSGCGLGITSKDPIKVVKYDWGHNIDAYAVGGTPADCIKLGLNTLVKKEPNLIVSGINKGANLGTDVLYSGTVAAAIEAIIHNIPALALSLNTYEGNDFSLAYDIAQYLTKEMLSQDIPKDTLLNVNIPYIKKDEFKGFKATQLGERKYKNIYLKETDHEQNDHYLLKGTSLRSDLTDERLDIIAVQNNYASITPVHIDLTDYEFMEKIHEWKLKNSDY